MKKLTIAFAILGIAFFVAACGSKEKAPASAMQNELDGAPDWVLNESSGGNGLICGVGSATGTRNVALARTAAQGRGRTAIARALEVKVKAMLKDYQSTTTGGEGFGQAANDEQHIEDVSKQITDTTLSGTEQKNTWISKTGTLYVQMCMDVEKFKGAVQQMQQLDEKLRQAIVERADKAFKELDEATK